MTIAFSTTVKNLKHVPTENIRKPSCVVPPQKQEEITTPTAEGRLFKKKNENNSIHNWTVYYNSNGRDVMSKILYRRRKKKRDLNIDESGSLSLFCTVMDETVMCARPGSWWLYKHFFVFLRGEKIFRRGCPPFVFLLLLFDPGPCYNLS